MNRVLFPITLVVVLFAVAVVVADVKEDKESPIRKKLADHGKRAGMPPTRADRPKPDGDKGQKKEETDSLTKKKMKAMGKGAGETPEVEDDLAGKNYAPGQNGPRGRFLPRWMARRKQDGGKKPITPKVGNKLPRNPKNKNKRPKKPKGKGKN